MRLFSVSNVSREIVQQKIEIENDKYNESRELVQRALIG